MPGHRYCLPLLLSLLIAGPLRADEAVTSTPAAPSGNPAAPARPSTTAATGEKSAGSATEKAAPAASAAPKAALPATASPQRFNPSERVRADYPVAFPIDI